MIAQPLIGPSEAPSPTRGRSYTHAHWYFLAAFAVIVAGFWPTFFKPLGSPAARQNIHGLTASLWYVALMLQSWLMARGHIKWHRRAARGIVVLLPVLCISALANTRYMLTTSAIPPFARPTVAFLDFQLVLQLVVFVILGLLNRRTPAAHKRFMAATALAGLPPALARLYDHIGIRFSNPITPTQSTIVLICAVLVAVDWRHGERRLAYPLMLLWSVAILLCVGPLAATPWWLSFCRWFATPA